MVNMAANEPAVLNRKNYSVAITSPNATTALLGTSSVNVIGANPVRRGIIFFNPGTVTLFVTPANQVAVIGQGVPILPQSQQAFINSDDGMQVYNCGWNAIAASSSGNVLTIFEML